MRQPSPQYLPIYDLLQKCKLNMTTKNNNRKGFMHHRRATFGYLVNRIGRVYGLGSSSKRFPDLYKALIQLGNSICPHPFTSIHVVKNLTCLPHKDKNNVGESTIIAIGEYTGGQLTIEGLGTFDTFENPITFNGYERTHWNTNDLNGTKYSLIYFSCADPRTGIAEYISDMRP